MAVEPAIGARGDQFGARAGAHFVAFLRTLFRGRARKRDPRLAAEQPRDGTVGIVQRHEFRERPIDFRRGDDGAVLDKRILVNPVETGLLARRQGPRRRDDALLLRGRRKSGDRRCRLQRLRRSLRLGDGRLRFRRRGLGEGEGVFGRLRLAAVERRIEIADGGRRGLRRDIGRLGDQRALRCEDHPQKSEAHGERQKRKRDRQAPALHARIVGLLRDEGNESARNRGEPQRHPAPGQRHFEQRTVARPAEQNIRESAEPGAPHAADHDAAGDQREKRDERGDIGTAHIPAPCPNGWPRKFNRGGGCETSGRSPRSSTFAPLGCRRAPSRQPRRSS